MTLDFNHRPSFADKVNAAVTLAKPVYAAQIALYQACMEVPVLGISAAPALFTAINKDTTEMHHERVAFDAALAQRMSDRAVRILRATDAGELLPRIATSRDFFECRFCPWAARCWGEWRPGNAPVERFSRERAEPSA